MGDHGARAIIPLNVLTMIGCVAVSLFTLPWWITVLVVLTMIAIRNFATDQYGGMQICLLLLPGLLCGLGTLARLFQEVDDGERSVGILQALWAIAMPILLFGSTLLLFMFGVLVVSLAGEWAWARLRERTKR